MSDWYKDYNIKVIPSLSSGVTYRCITKGKIKIDEELGFSWGFSMDQKLKDNKKTIYHKIFVFFLKTRVDRATLLRCCENIEKLYLLLLLKCEPVFNIKGLIKLEGSEIEIISEELVEDIASLTLDEELRMATKDKEIYFFKRLGWQIDTREVWHPWEAEVKVQARFNFLVINE